MSWCYHDIAIHNDSGELTELLDFLDILRVHVKKISSFKHTSFELIDSYDTLVVNNEEGSILHLLKYEKVLLTQSQDNLDSVFLILRWVEGINLDEILKLLGPHGEVDTLNLWIYILE